MRAGNFISEKIGFNLTSSHLLICSIGQKNEYFLKTMSYMVIHNDYSAKISPYIQTFLTQM